MSYFDAVDLPFFRERLDPFLPRKLFDAHLHIARLSHFAEITAERKLQNWALGVCSSFPYLSAVKVYRKLFPGRSVQALAMGMPIREVDVDANNEYAEDARTKAGFQCLYMTRPNFPPEKLRTALRRGFLGFKPYVELAGKEDLEQVGIFDMFPEPHLDVANSERAIVLLHIPRKGRLKDPCNIEELRALVRNFPRARVVLAHCGRSYCRSFAEEGFPKLWDLGLWFDLAAMVNPEVFELAFTMFDTTRILWGTDLPVMLMRGVREYHGDTYKDFTRGNYVWNRDRKPPEVEATYTFYVYKELEAILQAARAVRLPQDRIEDILCHNAMRLCGLNGTV